jgi:hypothetical protein
MLLGSDGRLRLVELGDPLEAERSDAAIRSRTAYAAAHVVPVAWADNVPGSPAKIDWDATLAFRRNVWSWGLGVADAMDTAQRNMGLEWAATAELIRRSAAEAREVGGDLVVGVNTDHLVDAAPSLDAIVAGYLEQLEVAEEAGAGVVIMASRHLARVASGPADYERVYREVLRRAGAPIVLHWLGEVFDAQLAGYFGSDFTEASATVIRIIEEHVDTVRGIKMSLLDDTTEIDVRRRLPESVTMFTGDDFNYVSLIEGDDQGHSDALLGAFAAIAPTAAVALRALDAGEIDVYRAVLKPTEALARQIFSTPTQYYKTGVAFLSWLNGHQPAFQMVGGLHSGRSLVHLSEIVRLADDARALERPDVAAERWNSLLAVNGLVA